MGYMQNNGMTWKNLEDANKARLPEFKNKLGEPAHSQPDGNESSSDGDDPLLADAVKRVVETGKCSIAFVQRDLKIGYNRAARLVDLMEGKGVISPANASGHRQVLVADA